MCLQQSVHLHTAAGRNRQGPMCKKCCNTVQAWAQAAAIVHCCSGTHLLVLRVPRRLPLLQRVDELQVALDLRWAGARGRARGAFGCRRALFTQRVWPATFRASKAAGQHSTGTGPAQAPAPARATRRPQPRPKPWPQPQARQAHLQQALPLLLALPVLLLLQPERCERGGPRGSTTALLAWVVRVLRGVQLWTSPMLFAC